MKRIRMHHLMIALLALSWAGCEKSEAPPKEAPQVVEPVPQAAPPTAPTAATAAPAASQPTSPVQLPPVQAVPTVATPPAPPKPVKAGGDERIALLMKARTNPFFDKMASGAEDAAKKFGVKLEILAIDKETDAEKQAAQRGHRERKHEHPPIEVNLV